MSIRLDDGNESRAEESLEDAMRFRAVEVAWQLLAAHPNWVRGYGLAVREPESPAFLASMRALKEELEQIVEWETYNEQDLPRRPDPPDYLEALFIAMHLLLTEETPVRPLPLLVGSSLGALASLYACERAGVAPVPVSSDACDGEEDEDGAWWECDECTHASTTLQ